MKSTDVSRRAFLRFAGGLGSALLVTACSSSPGAGPAAAATNPSTSPPVAPAATGAVAAGSSGKVTVNLWQHEYPPNDKAYKMLIADFEKANPDVTVAFDTVSANDFEQKLLTALAAGAGPDIFRMPTWTTASYVTKGIVKPLDPTALGKSSHQELLNEYDPPSSVDGWIWEGKLYSIPVEMSVLEPWYRLDVMGELGMDKSKLPANWDDLWALCQKMTQKDSSGKISRIGFNWTWNDIWTMHQFSPILAQVKGSILSDDGKTVTLDSPEGLRALEIYGGAYKLGAASKAFNVPQAFENAKQGVLISGPFEPATVLSVNSKLEYSKDFVNGRFPQVPGDEPVAYIWGPTSLTPNPKSKVTSQLYAVIKFMWDRPQVFWNVANLLVTRKILLQSEDLKKAPWIPTFLEDYKIARPAVKSYIYAEIQTALFQMAQAVVVENKDAKSALRQAAADISKALASQ